MKNVKNLHELTHAAIEQLQQAFQECQDKSTEGVILSAMVTVKLVHDGVIDLKDASADIEWEEFCCAV